jgi:hypothetical protein
VEHKEYAHTAIKTITVDGLHCHVGHSAPDTAKLLVKKVIVEGIKLNKSQGVCICDSYQFTAAKQSNVSI